MIFDIKKDITIKDILEGNRQLAEFIGWELKEVKGKNKHFHHKFWFINGVKSFGLNQLHFESNMDMLFQVVDKIGSIAFKMDFRNAQDNWKDHYSYFDVLKAIWGKSDYKYLMNSSISLWYSVINYVRWYNNNNIPIEPKESFETLLDNWQNSFSCSECDNQDFNNFTYQRTVANGEVWRCEHCKTESVVGNQPKE
jgi:hypothetical protein